MRNVSRMLGAIAIVALTACSGSPVVLTPQHPNPDADTERRCDGDADPDRNGDAHTGGDGDADTRGDRNSHPDTDPVPTATNVLSDAGFETEGAAMAFSAWTPCSYPHPAYSASPVPAITSGITSVLVSASSPTFTIGSTPVPMTTAPTPIATVQPSAHGGTYAALTYSGTGADSAIFPPATTAVASNTNGGANGICQSFTVPQNAVLNVYVNEGGYESGVPGKYGDQEATLFAGTNLGTATPITVFQDLNTSYPPSTATNGYVLRGPYALTGAPYNLVPGTTATLFLGTYDSEPSNKYGEFMEVDDASVVGIPETPVSIRRGTAAFGIRR